MRIIRFFQVLFVLAILSAPVWALDYDVDTTFAPQLPALDYLYDVYVQPDGKIVIAGVFSQINGTPRQYIARINADGTTDLTFTSPFSVPVTAPGYVTAIKPLANGQLLISGQFRVGSQYTTYARLNADGTFDSTMTALGTMSQEDNQVIRGTAEPLPNGQFLMCGARSTAQDTFSLIYRLNANGTEDTSFHLDTFLGFCGEIKPQADGKILMAGAFIQNNGNPMDEPIIRLNADGSRDTFHPELPAGFPGYFTQLPNGKLVVSNGTSARRLNTDGSLDVVIPNCGGGVLYVFPDGRLLMSGCKRWSGGEEWDFASVLLDGSLEQDMAWTNFDLGVGGFRDVGNGNLLGYGRFALVDNKFQRNLVRLKPDTAPAKAPYDFDNDGKSDIAVFRPSDATWYIYQSTAGPRYLKWGISTDKPAAAHFDTDGRTDIAILRGDAIHSYSDINGYNAWYFNNVTNGKPVFGDFDADDIEDLVVRGLISGNVRWVKRMSFGNFFQTPDPQAMPGEQITDSQALADYDGDRRVDLAYFRDGTWSIAATASGPAQSIQWGSAGDIPVPADYDGDHRADLAVFRPSTGVWWVLLSSGGHWAIPFGLNGDIPVPADYDGDGKTDIAVYRNGVWWQYLSATGTVAAPNWGLAGDLPIPAQSQ